MAERTQAEPGSVVPAPPKPRWRPTLIEILVVVAILSILAAILLPPVRWAASGEISIAVHVFVFDAADSRPISGARIGLLRGSPWLGEPTLDDPRLRVPPEGVEALFPPDSMKRTGPDGIALVQYAFRTGSSYLNPVPRAHTNYAWLVVEADGYGAVLVPVDRRSTPTAELKPHREIRLPVGLVAPRPPRAAKAF